MKMKIGICSSLSLFVPDLENPGRGRHLYADSDSRHGRLARSGPRRVMVFLFR